MSRQCQCKKGYHSLVDLKCSNCRTKKEQAAFLATQGRVIAVIGTAGRDKSIPMTMDHWNQMCEVVWTECQHRNTALVSGGAAWADHVAVWAFLNGYVKTLHLHLPAPFDMHTCKFVGEYGTSGGTANYYHEKFSRVLGCNTLAHIKECLSNRNCTWSTQPVANGYGAMAARNRLVAEDCTHMLAFTFGVGDVPADGGTKITWDMAAGKERVHVPLRK